MNVMETLKAAEQLTNAGYSILSSTATTLTVADPSQVSNGLRRWIEFDPRVLRTTAAVTRFIADRS